MNEPAAAPLWTKIVYWLSTALLCALMIFSATMYLRNYEAITQVFEKLGHPAHIVYPLAFAKYLGVIVIVTRKFPRLVEWAYAGFCFDVVLAMMAHHYAGEGFLFSGVGFMLVLSSYFSGHRGRPMA